MTPEETARRVAEAFDIEPMTDLDKRIVWGWLNDPEAMHKWASWNASVPLPEEDS